MIPREEWLAILDRDSRVARGFRLRNAAADRRALIAAVRDLARLLKYPHAYSSAKHLMPDAWREDAAAALAPFADQPSGDSHG